jgi:hypothetical protein
MATYNGERYLSAQLESLRRQSRLPDELVISDDDSSDRTLDIAEAFAARAPFEVRILCNHRNIGWSNNFFRAIGACSGKIVALCDQDDVWLPDKLAFGQRAFASDPDAALVVHSARVVNEALRPLWSDPGNHIKKRETVQAGIVPPLGRTYAGFTMMVRATYVDAIRQTESPSVSAGALGLGHDGWLTLVCGGLGNVHRLCDELVLYRRHAATATLSWSGDLATAGDAKMRLLYRAHFAARKALYAATEEAHRERSRQSEARAFYLEGLKPAAEQLGAPASRGLDRCLAAHKLYAEAMERRALLYSSLTRRARVRGIAAGLARGDYGPRERGGLGAASLAKDVTVSCVA